MNLNAAIIYTDDCHTVGVPEHHRIAFPRDSKAARDMHLRVIKDSELCSRWSGFGTIFEFEICVIARWTDRTMDLVFHSHIYSGNKV